ncbi:unnamed protein product [Sympodiomycopsis kandeliae]
MVSPQSSTAPYISAPQPQVTVQSLPLDTPHGIPTKQLTRTIDGVETSIVIQEYSDRSFVLVTQLRRIGVVIQASVPADTPLSSAPTQGDNQWNDDFEDDDPDDSVSDPLSHSANLVQTPLLGIAPSDQADLYSLYVSVIHGIIRSNNQGTDEQKDHRPVIVSLALKTASGSQSSVELMAEEQREVFLQVVQAVKDCHAQPK